MGPSEEGSGVHMCVLFRMRALDFGKVSTRTCFVHSLKAGGSISGYQREVLGVSSPAVLLAINELNGAMSQPVSSGTLFQLIFHLNLHYPCFVKFC